jgi:hypothetical protein
MATRGTVFTIFENKVLGIYNHFDSYPFYLGEVLNVCYNTYEEVLELISHGHATCITETISSTEFYEKKNDAVEMYSANSIEEFISKYGEEYNYYFDPALNKWIIL